MFLYNFIRNTKVFYTEHIMAQCLRLKTIALQPRWMLKYSDYMYIRYIWMYSVKYSYPGGVTNSDTTPDIFPVAQPRVFLFRRCLRKFLSTNGTRKLTYMDAHTT